MGARFLLHGMVCGVHVATTNSDPGHTRAIQDKIHEADKKDRNRPLIEP